MNRSHPLAEWLSGLGRLLARCAKRRWHGTIEITIFDGEVRQMVVKSSVVDPTQLALADDDGMRVD